MRVVRSKRAASSAKGRFTPAVGAEFDVEEAPVIDAKTRGFVARAIVLAVGAALIVAGSYGLVTRNFMPVEVVWAIGGPLIGAVVAYYFGPRKDTG